MTTPLRSVFDEALAGVAGALEIERDPHGVVFHRSPRLGRALLPGALDYVSATPSGVRLELITDAPTIELEVELVRGLYPGTNTTGSIFEVVVDGAPHGAATVAAERIVDLSVQQRAQDLERGAHSTVAFDLGDSARERHVELWFPVVSVVRLVDVRIPTGSVVRPAAERPRWLHHGSSISQASDALRPLATWPVQVARSTGHSLLNLGLAGQCHIDPFMAEAIRDTPAAAISLELGINVVNLDSMSRRTFTPAVHGFLETVRSGHPETPIAVISPLSCPAHEHAPGPTLWIEGRIAASSRPPRPDRSDLTVAGVREALAAAVERRRSEGDHRLHLIDGRDLLSELDTHHLPDGLHPDVEGQRLIASRFARLAFASGAVFG